MFISSLMGALLAYCLFLLFCLYFMVGLDHMVRQI